MLLLLVPFLLGFGVATAPAQDPAKVAPGDYKVEIENEWVRILRSKRGTHSKVPMHEHPDQVVVFLTDTHQRVTSADGRVQEITRKAGDVVYGTAVRHTEENLSDQPLEAIVVELKPGASKSAPVALDPVKLDPKYHTVPIENDRVRVLRTVLEPGVKSPLHEHPHYVVVYLTELHTTMTLADGRTVDNPRRPGDVAWRDYMKHETVNVGERTAVEYQIELK